MSAVRESVVIRGCGAGQWKISSPVGVGAKGTAKHTTMVEVVSPVMVLEHCTGL